MHARLLRQVDDLPDLTLHDLYEAYPDFDIDVEREQQLLLQHDLIIWQHPFYWYNAPALIKQWQDLVLAHGWAYGTGGRQLQGKAIFNVISCGGPRAAYEEGGRNRFTIRQLLAPFDQTAHLCGMQYLSPFVIHGTHQLTTGEMDGYALQYRQLLQALADGQVSASELHVLTYANDHPLFHSTPATA